MGAIIKIILDLRIESEIVRCILLFPYYWRPNLQPHFGGDDLFSHVKCSDNCHDNLLDLS